MRFSCVLALSLALTSGATAVRAADAVAKPEKAEVCLACHGVDGVSQIPGTPSLVGQPDRFIQWELVFFRSGRRHDPIMEPIASTLSDEDVRSLGAYIASLPVPKLPVPPDSAPDETAGGAGLVKQGNCAACHGETFEGLQAAPRLAGQREEYIVKALKDFRSGGRPSMGLAAMTEVAAHMSDENIDAVAHFLARQR
jgi:cytochrome c553